MDKPESERVITPMPKALVDRIDDYRFANRVPSRSEAVRRLIEAGLTASAPFPGSAARARRRPA
jgi:metal-responsive CopG/Arc/MetJ family transcriptional regulator